MHHPQNRYPEGWIMHAQAGAGIVYDSVPTSEFTETENKAMALIRAAVEANNLHRRDRSNQ